MQHDSSFAGVSALQTAVASAPGNHFLNPFGDVFGVTSLLSVDRSAIGSDTVQHDLLQSNELNFSYFRGV